MKKDWKSMTGNLSNREIAKMFFVNIQLRKMWFYKSLKIQQMQWVLLSFAKLTVRCENMKTSLG